VIKGFMFPSYKDQIPSGQPSGQGSRALPRGQQWLRHAGFRQRMKVLRQQCRELLRSEDPEILAAIEKIRFSTSTEKTPEYGKLYLMNKIREIADDNGIPFPEATDLILASMQKLVQEHTDAQDEAARSKTGDRGHSGDIARQSDRSSGDSVPQREVSHSSVETPAQA
jgi:hypothetical protein